ncbi:MAG: 1-acyl-sn-glycerol-3-phosphate acyltransferase [Candidatus Hydrogenedentes bacterium]|nr:1-acyl-sn-glycerol-3-phosphate acyltransferase [Candidatus Hydrogenedentota bacterium]
MEPWEYHCADDLDRSLADRLRQFPRRPDMLVYGGRLAAMALVRTWMRAYHRFRVTGCENLPREGSFVVVANHSSHLDVFTLLMAFPMTKLHRVFPAAAQDYFFVSLPRVAFAAGVVNALPFDRQVGIKHSLGLCTGLLSNPGNVLVIFPEGTRSLDGVMHPFKPGIGLLLAGTPYPVVPCYIEGAHDAWAKGKWIPRPRRVRLFIGTPRVYSELKPGKQSALQITSELEDAVASLAPNGGTKQTRQDGGEETASTKIERK